MKLRAILLPVVFVGVLQLSGCTSPTTTTPIGGTYISESAGAHFDQSVELVNSAAESAAGEATIAGFTLQHAHRPLFDPDTIYVAAGPQGLVISNDGGATWRQVGTPLASVFDVVALENDVLLVAGTDVDGQGFLFRTVDEGKSWQTVLTVPQPVRTSSYSFLGGNKPQTPAVVISIAPDPFHPDRVYAGTSLGNILLGEQSAKTWRTVHTLSRGNAFVQTNQTQFAITDVIPSPHVDGELMIITAQGELWRLGGDEQTQLGIPQNLDNPSPFGGTGQTRDVQTVTYVPEFPQALLVGVNDGAVLTRDGGESWEQLPLPVDTVQNFNSSVVAVSPTNSNRLLVGINSVIYRSEDGGQTWNSFNLGLKSFAIVEVLIDPTNAANVLVVTTPIGA